MSTNIVPFEFGGEQIRVEMIDGNPWFIASDISRILGYRDAAAISRNVEADEKGTHPVSTPGGVQQLTIINESGLYNAIFASKVPGAREFKKHVTAVILPQIRRTGSYAPVVALPDLTTPEGVLMLAQTLTKTAEQLVEAKNEVAELSPLASQARTFNRRKGNVGRLDFARDIVAWSMDNGYPKVTVNNVYAFMGGKKLDLFIHDKFRRNHGHASASGIRRGLSFTNQGVSPVNGHDYQQGMLLPKGYEYAWSRIESYVREHGHLELPKKEVAA